MTTSLTSTAAIFSDPKCRFNSTTTNTTDTERFCESFINKLHFSLSTGLPHALPLPTFQATEHDLVKGVLHMLQGFCSSLFYWDDADLVFRPKQQEMFVTHLSHSSLNRILLRFLFAASCLKRVELVIHKAELSSSSLKSPTLRAFAGAVSSWLKRLRDTALKEEIGSIGSETSATTTLLGLTNSLSSLCSASEHLFQVVNGALPSTYFRASFSACETAVHILNSLFKKLNEVCLLQDGEDEAYHMILSIFAESLLPYLEGLDSWLYDGTLDDPFEEMYFYANDEITIDQPAFWEMSFVLRRKMRKDAANGGSLLSSKAEVNIHVTREISDQEQMAPSSSSKENEQDDMDTIICPVFIKDIAKSILSAGKSLQLVRHGQSGGIDSSGSRKLGDLYEYKTQKNIDPGSLSSCREDQLTVQSNFSRHYSVPEALFSEGKGKSDQTCEDSNLCFYEHAHSGLMGVLTLPETFLVSLVGLLGDNDHIYEHFRISLPGINHLHKSCILKKTFDEVDEENKLIRLDKMWLKFLAEVYLERGYRDVSGDGTETLQKHHFEDSLCLLKPSFFGNPVTTVCRQLLKNNMGSWKDLNVSENLFLPPMNDEYLRNAIFCDKNSNPEPGKDPNEVIASSFTGTNYTSGFQFDEIELLRSEDEIKDLQNLYAFPTLLPYIEDSTPVSELLPFQRNSTLASKILTWIRTNRFKDPVQPAVVVQECIAVYVKEQVDNVGKHILRKLMSDWKLLDELSVLRAIYLLGSGDVLQQFLIVIFNKLDKGDTWDDDFELNTILQESIRNSADGELLSAPDSLVVSLSKYNASDSMEAEGGNVSTPLKVRSQCFGIDSLDMLKFTYKVSWPLDLIANSEALKKYNQVMNFLLKVKRAKFALDKTRKWTWKGRCTKAHNHKRHLLVQLKLLHFVDAFHQYVMDRVLHNAWNELYCGMASAGSLDAVIDAHESYLLSIQRQCFVAPDKLWALIASRIKTILGLALDFYSIQQTLNSGGAAAAIKARCEMELDRIEKQFDDCIAFLLRILSFKLNVGHFPHLADLVTRINYNYFYMSDSGNLLTVPSFEATAKVRKISAFRAN